MGVFLEREGTREAQAEEPNRAKDSPPRGHPLQAHGEEIGPCSLHQGDLSPGPQAVPSQLIHP